jgi:hypothetical protein
MCQWVREANGLLRDRIIPEKAEREVEKERRSRHEEQNRLAQREPPKWRSVAAKAAPRMSVQRTLSEYAEAAERTNVPDAVLT